MEFIFGDDCSPDNSITLLKQVLAQYPQRIEQTVILSNGRNRGQLQTRSSGLLHATGTFVGTVDSDDWVEPDTFKTLYQRAEEEKADCVLCGYHRDFSDHTEACPRVFPYTRGRDLVENVYKFPFEFFMWGALLRNEDRLRTILLRYYNNPDWEGVTMWEDVAVMLPYYYGAEKIAYCDDCFYHYNKANVSSAVNNQNEEKVYQALKVVDYLREMMSEPSIDLTLQNLAFGAKNPLKDLRGARVWREEHKVSNRYILKYTSIPKRLRYMLWLMAHGISFPYYWGVKLSRALK